MFELFHVCFFASTYIVGERFQTTWKAFTVWNQFFCYWISVHFHPAIIDDNIFCRFKSILIEHKFKRTKKKLSLTIASVFVTIFNDVVGYISE